MPRARTNLALGVALLIAQPAAAEGVVSQGAAAAGGAAGSVAGATVGGPVGGAVGGVVGGAIGKSTVKVVGALIPGGGKKKRPKAQAEASPDEAGSQAEIPLIPVEPAAMAEGADASAAAPDGETTAPSN
jgi:hypothetical protein